jgi:hypothetical protein
MLPNRRLPGRDAWILKLDGIEEEDSEDEEEVEEEEEMSRDEVSRSRKLPSLLM